MTGHRLDALVLGAGVIGLTTAVHLAETGLRVEVRTSVPPEQTTSAAAGAMWGLFLVEREESVIRWSRETLHTLVQLADDKTTGVRLARGVEASRTPAVLLDGVDLLLDLRRCRPAELPPGFQSGFRYTVPMVDMPAYLQYLCERLRAAGGHLRVATVHRLEDAAREAGAIVNCTGIRARELSGDAEVYPIRGQVVVAENPGLTDFFTEDSDTSTSTDLLYIFPHDDKVVLGGTAEPGRWSLDPDPLVAAAIVARCAEVEPSLATAQVLGHRVGLRPRRSRVRLEEERLHGNGTRVIHSYGHGGAGVSLSWGCAFEVSRRLLR
jgi:D-amino-acid oxidase